MPNMKQAEIQSAAFHQAALRSERLRIVGMIAVLAVVAAIAIARSLLVGEEGQLRMVVVGCGLAAVLVAYEAIMLVYISGAVRHEFEPKPWIWVLNVLIESLLPTALLIVLTSSPFIGPYRALVAPIVGLYYFFIILSTLRLSPTLCVLTGLFSALGYSAVTLYTYWRYSEPAHTNVAFPGQIYFTYAVMILLAGFAAGAVAHRIRAHVNAALREAETRREMERLEHDLDIARSIQQGLLPDKPPSLDGFEIAGWSQPADQTGGDYFDWQQLPDGQLAVSLADVTGHGIGPALVTAVCRAYARASFPSKEELGTLVDRINELLVEDLVSGRFVTFVVARLDPAAASVQLLSAGHGPLFLFTASNDQVREFRAHDIPFGIAANIGYGPPQEIDLAPGDMLVLITDGFFEWANAAGEQYGTERLREAIRTYNALPAKEIISRIYASVREFVGDTPQGDDLTAVVLKRNAQSSVA